MQFGSVRFFKYIFLSCLILMIAIPTSVAVYFGILLNKSQNSFKPSPLSTIDFSEKSEELKPPNIDIRAYPPADDAIGSISKLENIAETPDYVELFPELYAHSRLNEKISIPKTGFLTFDDGPSARTVEILDILSRMNVKATFFIVGNSLETEENQNILKRIASEGHTIGIHTMSHKYSDIYSSIEAFLADFNQAYERIYEITGTKCEIFRFPGGSINSYNGDIYQALIAEMTRRGFSYFDWNVSAEDAVATTLNIEKTCDKVIHSSLKTNRAIILMHDSADKYTTVKSIEIIINALSKEGFTFLPLSADVKPIIFGYK